MTWKNLSYWLRGGIYAAIIYPVVYHLLVLVGTALENAGSRIDDYFFFPIFFLVLPIIPFRELFGINKLTLTIIMMIIGFVIGAVIGLIIRRIKNRSS